MKDKTGITIGAIILAGLITLVFPEKALIGICLGLLINQYWND